MAYRTGVYERETSLNGEPVREVTTMSYERGDDGFGTVYLQKEVTETFDNNGDLLRRETVTYDENMGDLKEVELSREVEVFSDKLKDSVENGTDETADDSNDSVVNDMEDENIDQAKSDVYPTENEDIISGEQFESDLQDDDIAFMNGLMDIHDDDDVDNPDIDNIESNENETKEDENSDVEKEEQDFAPENDPGDVDYGEELSSDEDETEEVDDYEGDLTDFDPTTSDMDDYDPSENDDIADDLRSDNDLREAILDYFQDNRAIVDVENTIESDLDISDNIERSMYDTENDKDYVEKDLGEEDRDYNDTDNDLRSNDDLREAILDYFQGDRSIIDVDNAIDNVMDGDGDVDEKCETIGNSFAGALTDVEEKNTKQEGLADKISNVVNSIKDAVGDKVDKVVSAVDRFMDKAGEKIDAGIDKIKATAIGFGIGILVATAMVGGGVDSPGNRQAVTKETGSIKVELAKGEDGINGKISINSASVDKDTNGNSEFSDQNQEIGFSLAEDGEGHLHGDAIIIGAERNDESGTVSRDHVSANAEIHREDDYISLNIDYVLSGIEQEIATIGSESLTENAGTENQVEAGQENTQQDAQQDIEMGQEDGGSFDVDDDSSWGAVD